MRLQLLGSLIGSLLKLPDSGRQAADEVLSPMPLARQSLQRLQPPPLDQHLQYVGVVVSRVDPEPLSHGGEVLE